MHKLAIDFGTSNTLVAEWNEAARAPRTLRLPTLGTIATDAMPSVIPSLLYVQDAARDLALAGAEVSAGGYDVSGDRRFFAGFKRAIAAEIQGFVPQLDGVALAPHKAGELFLTRVFDGLVAAGHPLDEVIFTVPVLSFERYLHWLTGVAARAGIPHMRVLDESTAAALGYQVAGSQALVLVIDFGGGTLDVSLVRTPAAGQAGFTLRPGAAFDREGVAQVLAKGGQVLGGEDIDAWLLEDFARRNGLAPDEVQEDRAQLMMLVERAKIALSREPSAEVTFFSSRRLKTLQTSYARSDFEDLLEAHDFYRKLQSTLDAVLRQAEVRGVKREAIAQVLLVGGTTLIPSVQRAIRQNFGSERVRSHAPFEAVAHGALGLLKGLKVEDFLHHGYGIRYWDPRAQAHAFEPIFSPGHRYPSIEPVELVLRASRPGQPAIELVIGEAEAGATGASEVVFDGGRLVTTRLDFASARIVPLNDAEGAKTIAALDPPGYPGVDRVRVHFRVDDRRQLRLTVHDLQTDRRLLDDEPVIELH